MEEGPDQGGRPRDPSQSGLGGVWIKGFRFEVT